MTHHDTIHVRLVRREQPDFERLARALILFVEQADLATLDRLRQTRSVRGEAEESDV